MLHTVGEQAECILHGESALPGHVNTDVDSSRGCVSREGPMFSETTGRVVPALIACDSSFRDAQMT